jgi:hypothetical protein
MSTRTAIGKGLSKPHKEVAAAVPGHGSALQNARSINTEKGGHNPKVGCSGLAHTYFGNSRDISSTDRKKR